MLFFFRKNIKNNPIRIIFIILYNKIARIKSIQNNLPENRPEVYKSQEKNDCSVKHHVTLKRNQILKVRIKILSDFFSSQNQM